jgi:peptide chain release factor 3
MEVCRRRDTPVMVFINKLDREGQDPYDLLDEIEDKLAIKVHPLSWPIGMGKRFKGVYSLYERALHLFESSRLTLSEGLKIEDINSPDLQEHIGDQDAAQLREDVELVDGIYGELNPDDYLKAKVAPVFFGSAVNNFGVRELLDCFLDIAPNPLPRETEVREIFPDEDEFTGFVFKIHANMDPRHRNRIAFVRVCSGKFERKKSYLHARLAKQLKFSNATAFMAQDKEIINEAFPGDIVGLYDTGNLKIGDTLSEKDLGTYKGIPSFSPEIFKGVVNLDAMKSKQLDKGLRQLMDEGVAQLFTYELGSKRVVGTVGALQFEVIKYRLEHEYGAKCDFSQQKIHKACWIESHDKKKLKEFIDSKFRHIAKDKDGKLVFMAESKSWLQMVEENFPDIKFHFISEF